ncbi:chromobox protein homolog 1-like [Drosophila miranda]|uniref:chromobox protein homolog 1-like n=1 Tax=Drosophila miranda TaxID=7229 RepID=UPI0007E7A400|nr:chromobox protein homolog 1-like [Drosophila miranda]
MAPKKQAKKRRSTVCIKEEQTGGAAEPPKEISQQVGFQRNLQPDEISWAQRSQDQVMYTMKCKGSDIVDMVPAKESRTRCPHIVIQFLEERIKWETDTKDEDTAATAGGTDEPEAEAGPRTSTNIYEDQNPEQDEELQTIEIDD